jgi:alpha-tubulin suppressor-like RCC1 family protein
LSKRRSIPSLDQSRAMQDTATGTGYEPRSLRSAASSTHRPDLRWGRLTFAQLRDEEFLAKQVRRLEITQGARRAGRPTPEAANMTAPVKTIRQRLLAAQTKAARGTSEDEGLDTKDETLADVMLKLDHDADDKHERELTNALCVLGNLPQPELAALMVTKLKDALQRTCTVPNPVYQLIALRRQLMKSMHEAVAAQHRQRNVTEQLSLSIAERLETVPSPARTSALPAEAAGTLSGPTTVKPREKAAREAALGIQVLVCLLSDLHEPGVATLAQRREFLEDLLPLLRNMGFLVLSPRCNPTGNVLRLNLPTSRGSSRCLGTSGPPPGAADIAEFTDKIQRFLLNMCPRPTSLPLSSPKLPAISSGSGELDVLDRTNAVNGLIHVAAATGSVRDFLVVLRVLLGASDHADLPARELRSSLSSRSVLSSSVPTLATVRADEVLPSPIHSSRDDDEVTQVKLTVRPDSSKPQKGSPLSKRETEDSAVQDPLRRKTILKGLKTGANTTTTVSLAMPHSSSPHHRLLYSSPGNNLVGKQRAKEELKDVLLGNASLSLDMSKMKEATRDAAASATTTRSEPPVVTARCPKFKALDVQPVLVALGRAKPAAPTRTARTKLTSSVHSSPAGCFGSDANAFAGDEDDGDREVWSCGQNSYGELGHGDTASRKAFERVESLQQKDVVQVGAGNEHTIALTADGKVLTCGYNDNGQCGQGGTARVSHLSEMPKMGDSAIAQVHAYNGCEHTILVTMDGRAATCGYNYRGQLGHGNTASESVPKMVRSLENRIVRLVSCSYYHTVMACEEDGSGQQFVYTFGRNDYGQLGHNDSIDRKVPQHVEALSDQHVVSVACGQYHTMVVTATGKAFAFGKNDYGQLGVDSMENQLVPVQVRNGLEKQECLEIRCGYYHSIVLCSGAHLFGFGRNDYGQLGLGRANASSTANLQLQQQRYACARLIEELEGKDIVRLACGCYHTVAVSDNGVMYVFGRNNHGQLGTGDTNERVYPFPIDDFVGKRVALVAAGFYHTVVLTGGKDDDKTEQDAASSDKGEGATASALHGVTFSTILSNAAVQELVDPSRRPELDAGSALRKAAASDEAPAIDPTDADFRDEDSLVETASAASKAPADSADALFVAVVLTAQLDRLCQPFLPKPGSYPALHHPAMGVIDSLVASSTASASCWDVSGLFEGSFELFGVHNCSSTFESVAVLLKHLSTRKLDAASQLTTSLVQQTPGASATPRRSQPSAASQLQVYLLVACLRVLQANMAQMLRSGMAKAVILLSQDAHARKAGANPWAKELDRTRAALVQVREVLLALVDLKHRRNVCYVLDNAPTEGENAVRVAAEATAALMQGFELFFPCPCLQRQFFLSTMHDLSSEDRSCGGLCRRRLWPLDVLPRAKALLLEPMLRRIADDSVITRFLPVAAGSPVTEVYQLLLDQVAAEFTRRLGEAAAARPSSAVPPRQDSTLRALFDALSALQKHLSSWAASVHDWALKEDTGASTESIDARVASVVDRSFRVDERDLEHVPLAWRCFVEFVLATMGQCCEVLGHLVSTESIPSPTHGYDRHADAQDDALHTKMLEAVEHSSVGQLLPLLVVSLFEFSNKPLFAAALLPTVKSLLQLLDGFNARDRAAADAEKAFVASVAASACPRPAVKENGGSFRRKSDSSLSLDSARDEDGKPTSRKAGTTLNALALPWHYRLEKELAVLAAEMAVTLVVGDPFFTRDGQEHGAKISERWASSPLLRGGLSAKCVTRSVRHGGNQRSADTSTHARVVQHTPFPTAAAVGLPLQPFSLILSPPVVQDSEPRWALPTDANYGEMFRTDSVRGFLASLQGAEDPEITQGSHAAALKLCEWLRDSFAKRDPAYRMITRQSQLSMKLKASSNSAERGVHENDFRIEAAFFAVLLHHNVLASQAYHFALAIDRSTAETRVSPPRALLSVWHCVAQLRRRVASKKTEINNAPSDACESPRIRATERIRALQQSVLDRCRLLLLVDVYEEQEHLNLQLDAGFVAPHDPAFLVSSSSSFKLSAASAKRHLHAAYTDHKLPFLAAFPTSRWRKVRVLLHTVTRWKAVATAFQSSRQAISQDALAFVTCDEGVSSMEAINALLVDPCRRVSCSVRGLESLWELLTLVSFASIQVDVVHQVAHVFAFQSSGHAIVTGSRSVGYFYASLQSEAFAAFVGQVTEMMTGKAAELMASDEADAATSFWVVSALLSVWGVHFTAEQFEFVSDVGILDVIQEMLRGLAGKRGADSIHGEPPSTLPSVDSIVGRSGGQPTLAQLTGQAQWRRLEETLWVLFRYILAHFAVQNVDTTQREVLVPTFPVLAGVAELLYGEAAFVSSALMPLQAVDSTSLTKTESAAPAAPVAIRRSFEAVTSPLRFSVHSRGLTVSYDDMISPSSSETNPPMSPLLKPNEFSVTTWLYINTSPSARSSTADAELLDLSPELPDRQLVFLRGAARQVSLYAVVVPESADNWQLEVGILMDANREAEAAEVPIKGRVWERVLSKQVVAAGRWLHVAVVLEATKLRLYLNGVLDCQRSLAAQSVPVWAAGRVDLPLHFGRFPTDAESSAVAAAVGFLTRSLGTTKGAGWDHGMALPNSVPERKAAVCRCLDGWLCHFRFHNRSLSPIHVRIVFDEKKSPLSSLAADAASSTALKVVELHALLLVLTSSSEGLVHFSSQFPKWMRLVWGTFLGSNSTLVQQSALRVLRTLLPLQHPLEASKVLLQDASPEALGFGCGEDVFAQQVLRMIGFCLAKCPHSSSVDATSEATVVPWSLLLACGIHASLFSPEVRGRPEQQTDLPNDVERQYQRSKRQCSMLANELCQLLQQLFRCSNAAWRQSITAVISSLAAGVQDDAEQLGLRVLQFDQHKLSLPAIRRVESGGCLYFVGGAAEFLRPGVAVEMRGSREHAQVLSLEHQAARPSPETASAKPSGTADTLAFVHVDSSSNALETAGWTWSERVFGRSAAQRGAFPSYSKVHVDELNQTEASSPNVGRSTHTSVIYDLAAHRTDNGILNVLVGRANEVIPAVFSSSLPSQKTTSSELISVNVGCLLLKALVQVAGTSAGVDELLARPDLLAVVAELAATQDGNPRHETLRQVERRVSALRRELYAVLVELGEAGEVELDGLDVSAFQPETRPGSRGLSTARRSFTRSRSGGVGLSEAGLADAEADGPANENWDPAMGDDELDDPTQDEDEEDDGDDEESLEDEDEEAEETRAEFVEELMLMGFPEDWCVLALKQTENDIVSASAWIVDNLEYLSKLQSSLDQERDKGRDSPRFDEEVDDDVLVADTSGSSSPSQPPPLNASSSWAQSVAWREAGDAASRADSRSDAAGGTSTSTPPFSGSAGDGVTPPPLNDKEMGRKLFGEMYFPFEDGGFLSNTKSRFLRSWRTDAVEMKGRASNPQSIPDDTATAPREAFDEDFSTVLNALDLGGIVAQLRTFENALAILYARQCLATLLYQTTGSDTTRGLGISYAQWFQLLKLVLLRGDQFTVVTRANSSQLREVSVDLVFSRAFRCFHDRDAAAFTASAFAFCLDTMDAAASSKKYEALLWTQRGLQRPDMTVMDEPCIEVVVWLLDLLLVHDPSSPLSLSGGAATSVLRRLRCCLGTSNLPLKFVALRTISRLLARLPPTENMADETQLVARDFLAAASVRHSRELVQGRLLFSQYLHGYVELLHVLLQRTSCEDTTAPRALLASRASGEGSLQPAVPLLPPSAPSFPRADGSSLLFDRKRSRSSLLAFADDGLSVSYAGNEVWKAACAVVGFSTGVHAWSVRIEKSSSPYLFVGVAARQANLDSFLGADEQSWGFIGDKALYYQRNRVRAYGETFTEGDCIGLRLDCEKGELSFSKNGVDLGLAFDNVVGEVCPAVAFYSRHQKLSFVKDSCVSISEAPVAATGEDGSASVQDCLTACEILHNWVESKPMRAVLSAAAFTMTSEWLAGSTKLVTTRSGKSLWVDVTRDACGKLGFYADDRVRTPRGNGVVVGAAGGRVWVDVDNEPGAWFFHPSKLRVLTMASSTSSALPAPPVDDASASGDGSASAGAAKADAAPTPFSLSSRDLVEYGEHSLWTLAVDRELLSVANDFCEVARVSPWNLTPSELLGLVKEKTTVLELTCAGSILSMPQPTLERLVVARFALLRFCNLHVSRALPFLDLTWRYFASDATSLPCRLVSQCRGSLFVCVKNALWTALMERTANAPKRAEDEYDYPDDLPQLQVNRLRAAAAKCHEGTVRSLFSSLFGQAFEELHFLPLKTLRMVYSHPMDDGQLRSFKVKFEGEGVDDYGGPYREFFSQFFAELQMLHVPETESQPSSAGPSSTSLKLDPGAAVSACVLPFLLPSPNWRNGVGANREKFVLNGALISGETGTTAAVSAPGESAEEKRQLYCEMVFFLGQMIGICLRTRVCVRLDLAMSVWKQLVAEDDLSPESALETLKEIDFVAFSLWKTLRGVLDESKRLPTRRQDLEEQLEAMDLTFTTVLSDGRAVELREDGGNTVVTLTNLETYLDAMLLARVQETQDVMNIVKQGLHSVMPVAALALLTWTELEKRMCGVAEVDVKLLQANTEYDEELSPTDEFIQRFWRVLEGLESEDKRAFLRFVWARSRLPLGSAQFHQKFKIQALASSGTGDGSASGGGATAGWMDSQMPKSHTCFFALQLPRYSSDEICRDRLLYAVRNCVEMDGDFRLADTEMTGWTGISPTDQLRI